MSKIYRAACATDNTTPGTFSTHGNYLSGQYPSSSPMTIKLSSSCGNNSPVKLNADEDTPPNTQSELIDTSLVTLAPVHELTTQRYRKYGSNHIAAHFATAGTDHHIQSALDISRCSNSITVEGQTIRAKYRCNSRLCLSCASVRQAKHTMITVEAMKNIGYILKDDAHDEYDENRLIIGLKINLNFGAACDLADIKDRIKSLHRLWPRLLRIKHFDDILIGAMRGTEITYSEGDKANPHIHGILLLRADYDYDETLSKITRYWKNAVKRELLKISAGEPPDSSQCVQTISELQKHTLEDLRSWVNYISKSSYRLDGQPSSTEKHTSRLDYQISKIVQASGSFWIKLDSAIKGIRLIAHSGELKAAVKDAKEFLKSGYSARPSTKGSVTHRWSDRIKDYIPADEFTANDENHHPISTRLSYAVESPVAKIWKAERDYQEQAALEFEADRVAKTLSVNGLNIKINNTGEELLPTNTKTSWHEPNETERNIKPVTKLYLNPYSSDHPTSKANFETDKHHKPEPTQAD